MALRFGLFVPPFSDLAEPATLVRLAETAEEAGWDGFFLWDHILATPGIAVADPWITTAAIAQGTARIRIGMLVTPLVRRRPWVVARETATLDRLSDGRLVVGVGLGDDGWGEFSSFSEASDQPTRAAILEESLILLRRFWSGKEVLWKGKHFSVESPPFLPQPAQDPLPIWVACRWPHRPPLARAARHQGCFPLFDQGGWENPVLPDPAEVAQVRSELIGFGAPSDIDIVCRGVSALVETRERSEKLPALEAAGMTWWLECFGPDEPLDAVEYWVRKGPSRPDEDER
jgi:alkanesulfonate monooxygenase SsuD/methylene tetrahydromethanopterin reductase-like flavin-dependent oxidoreductase (luciferase family)